MSFHKQVIFWLGALALLVALVWLLQGVLLPFVGGLAIAYFLDPVADRLERLGLPRWAAASMILLGFLVIIALALLLLLPLLGDQISGFRNRLPSYVSALQRILAELNQGWLGSLVGDRLQDIQKSLGDYVGQGAALLGSFISSLWSGGQAVIGVVSALIVTPVVAFYILLDWDRMVARVDSWLPRDHVDSIRDIFRDIDGAIAGFVRGQATVSVLLGLFYGSTLTFAGISFGFLIGLCTGLASFIPYVGSILGFIVAISVSIVQAWPDWHLPIYVVAIFAVGQLLEGYVLSPRLVGGSVGLHPVWLMFSLLVAGSLFGFIGLLVAVPVAAAIGVLVRFGLRQYLSSSLYTGNVEPPVRRSLNK
ncbi:AI-2E family transporter [Labrys monachus]|uniref:PurR-regulated permease PerM n=1 Tax=Labrys monachus TaxID=217067 RepID=A0ABU0FKK4_9HYPH|nr:AI-2E family transporter [Labrys monachus]MDQ0395138.1 putative PurR-regulated permease PerM [Labrys monachus]